MKKLATIKLDWDTPEPECWPRKSSTMDRGASFSSLPEKSVTFSNTPLRRSMVQATTASLLRITTDELKTHSRLPGGLTQIPEIPKIEEEITEYPQTEDVEKEIDTSTSNEIIKPVPIKKRYVKPGRKNSSQKSSGSGEKFSPVLPGGSPLFSGMRIFTSSHSPVLPPRPIQSLPNSAALEDLKRRALQQEKNIQSPGDKLIEIIEKPLFQDKRR